MDGLVDGLGSGRAEAAFSVLEGVGSSVLETEIAGAEDTLISGTPWISMEGSGKLIVGTNGADAVELDVGRTTGSGLSGLLRLATKLEGEWSCLASLSLGFQSRLKLTIGLPGRSLTAVGVGSFGLLPLNRMLVAARMSSLRISTPLFDPCLLAFDSLSAAPVESGDVGGSAFRT